MQLEVGKFYKTREGRKVGPMQEFDSYKNLHPWESNGELWADDGTSYLGEYPDSDIIAEWHDEPVSPVRTVTRKEIVPGTYGSLEVLRSGLYRIMTDNAAELRAAIATLTQIAEALEETDQ